MGSTAVPSTVLIFLFSMIFGGIVFYIVIVQQKKRREKWKELFRTLDSTCAGRVEDKGWLHAMQYHFEIEGGEASLEFFSTGGKHPTYYTRLKCELQATQMPYVYVYPESVTSNIAKMFNAQDLQLNVPEFDKAFMIKGKDEVLIRQFLNSEVRDAIFQLKELSPRDHVEVVQQGTMLQIEVMPWIEEPAKLRFFVELSLKVLEGYRQIAF